MNEGFSLPLYPVHLPCAHSKNPCNFWTVNQVIVRRTTEGNTIRNQILSPVCLPLQSTRTVWKSARTKRRSKKLPLLSNQGPLPILVVVIAININNRIPCRPLIRQNKVRVRIVRFVTRMTLTQLHSKTALPTQAVLLQGLLEEIARKLITMSATQNGGCPVSPIPSMTWCLHAKIQEDSWWWRVLDCSLLDFNCHRWARWTYHCNYPPILCFYTRSQRLRWIDSSAVHILERLLSPS